MEEENNPGVGGEPFTITLGSNYRSTPFVAQEEVNWGATTHTQLLPPDVITERYGSGILEQIRQVDSGTVSYPNLTEESLIEAISEINIPTLPVGAQYMSDFQRAMEREAVQTMGIPSFRTVLNTQELPTNPEEGDTFIVTEDSATYVFSGGEYQLLQRERESVVGQMRTVQDQLNVEQYRNQVSRVSSHYNYPLTSEEVFNKKEDEAIAYLTEEDLVEGEDFLCNIKTTNK